MGFIHPSDFMIHFISNRIPFHVLNIPGNQNILLIKVRNPFDHIKSRLFQVNQFINSDVDGAFKFINSGNTFFKGILGAGSLNLVLLQLASGGSQAGTQGGNCIHKPVNQGIGFMDLGKKILGLLGKVFVIHYVTHPFWNKC